MRTRRTSSKAKITTLVSLLLLILLSACQRDSVSARPQEPDHVTPTTQATKKPSTPIALKKRVTPTPKPTLKAIPTPTPGTMPIKSLPKDNQRPVLAFYYPWYTANDWCTCKMSDLPTIQYNSQDDTTIARQLNWAAGAGITGFISSWWGANDKTDQSFAKLINQARTLESSTGYHFASSLYIESNAGNLNTPAKMVASLNYIRQTYSNSPYFFHWQGKPVLFFWDPLGGGRTLAQWKSIRQQVDPNNTMIWSAEGVDTNLFDVFDGLHLFSGGYWGLKNNRMAEVDAGFRSKIDAYNAAHNTQKIWAAGIIPGYDDTRLPNRPGAYSVPRNNGQTYRISWEAAIASKPEWVSITSFNEWFEGSMLEPSINYGNLYLNITREYATRWHG